MKKKPSVLHYLVANQMGGKEATQIATKMKDMNLLPWAGCAVRLPHVNQRGSLEGNAFVFLPIPARTGLGPMACNGYFELSSNRRDVWCESDDLAGDGAIRARWNKALMRDVCGPCFVRVMRMIATLDVSLVKSFYYNLFPSLECSSTWRPVLQSVYEIARNIPILPIVMEKEKVVMLRVSEIYVVDDSECPTQITDEIKKRKNEKLLFFFSFFYSVFNSQTF